MEHIDIAEFQELGFLQEANRQFFHPHGLALEITRVDEDGWTERSDGMSRQVADLADHLKALGWFDGGVAAEARARELLERMRPPGSAYLSGVWDCRDDPEGIVFSLGEYDDARQRSQTVAAERARHHDARRRMFHGDGAYESDGEDEDVEPLDYLYRDDDGPVGGS